MRDLDLSELKILQHVCPPDPLDEEHVTQDQFAAINIQVSLDADAESGGYASAVVHWSTGDRDGSIPVPIEFIVEAA